MGRDEDRELVQCMVETAKDDTREPQTRNHQRSSWSKRPAGELQMTRSQTWTRDKISIGMTLAIVIHVIFFFLVPYIPTSTNCPSATDWQSACYYPIKAGYNRTSGPLC